MKDGAEVRDLEELERAFDPDAIMKYFKSEQLETWLRERYYDDAADAISAIVKDDPNSGFARRWAFRMKITSIKNLRRVSEKSASSCRK